MKKVTILILPCLLLIISVGAVLISSSDKPKTEKVRQTVKKPLATMYSEKEIVSFWEKEMYQTAYEQLASSATQYPEVNKRFSEINQSVTEQKGLPINFELVKSYHPLGPAVEASAGEAHTNGQATVSLYIPAFLNTYKLLESSRHPKWRDVFKTRIIVVIMHEMEHLNRKDPKLLKVDLKEESRAWFDTCKYTISPLVETYKVPVDSDAWRFYDAWKMSGGDIHHPAWTSKIRNLYGDIEGWDD